VLNNQSINQSLL